MLDNALRMLDSTDSGAEPLPLTADRAGTTGTGRPSDLLQELPLGAPAAPPPRRNSVVRPPPPPTGPTTLGLIEQLCTITHSIPRRGLSCARPVECTRRWRVASWSTPVW
jgi:hypothetical protein